MTRQKGWKSPTARIDGLPIPLTTTSFVLSWKIRVYAVRARNDWHTGYSMIRAKSIDRIPNSASQDWYENSGEFISSTAQIRHNKKSMVIQTASLAFSFIFTAVVLCLRKFVTSILPSYLRNPCFRFTVLLPFRSCTVRREEWSFFAIASFVEWPDVRKPLFCIIAW